MSNLILRQSYNYRFEHLFPFVDSLKRSGYRGDVVLFVNGVPAESQAQLKSHGVTLAPFYYLGKEVRNYCWHMWPFLRRLGVLPLPFGAKKAILRPVLNIPWVRMILYYDWLVANRGRYENVMLSDVRDVVFQDDPFARLKGPGIQAFMEDDSMRMADSTSNIRWLTEIFGPEVYERMSKLPISCSGTIIGDAASIEKYLHAFIETAFSARSTRLNGGDQGIHNYLIQGPLKDAVTLRKNGEAEVLTMGYMARGQVFPTDAEGRLIDAEGRVFNVLHQYDRHPELAKLILERYPCPARA